MSKTAVMITGRHLWRTMIKDGKEVPVEMQFTEKAWAHLGHIRHTDGKLVPKQGFVQIPNVPTPPEATDGKTPAKAGKTAGPAINVEEVEALIKADAKDKLPIVLLVAFVNAKGLAIDNPGKLPQHDLLEKIKALI